MSAQSLWHASDVCSSAGANCPGPPLASTGRQGAGPQSLQHALLDSLHAVEARLAHISTSVSAPLHAVGHALRHPAIVSGVLTNATSQLPHELAVGVGHIRHGFDQGLRALHSSMAWNLSTLGGELRSIKLAELPESLDAWLHDVVRRSVMWPVPRWPMYVFMAGAMSCLFLSALCHLVGCCSRHVSAMIWRFDYAGIVANIVSSFYPSVYYAFLCLPGPRWTYLTGISACGGMTLAVSLLEVFQHPRWRPFRAACFAVLGLFGVVPWGHVVLFFPYSEILWTAMVMDALMGAAYLSGALIYTMRVPEKWFPGRFDLFFHSHQIFHVCVVVGAYCHYVGVSQLLKWRDAAGGCALDVTSHADIIGVHCSEGHLCGTSDLLAFLRTRLFRSLHGADAPTVFPSLPLERCDDTLGQFWDAGFPECSMHEL